MAYLARDGKAFPDVVRLRRYEGWMDAKDAPGGPAQQAALKEHGIPHKVTITREGNGRTRILADHPDGHHSTVVFGSNDAAHSAVADLMGVNPPIGQAAHRNANAHPHDKPEAKRLATEDQREIEADQP